MTFYCCSILVSFLERLSRNVPWRARNAGLEGVRTQSIKVCRQGSPGFHYTFHEHERSVLSGAIFAVSISWNCTSPKFILKLAKWQPGASCIRVVIGKIRNNAKGWMDPVFWEGNMCNSYRRRSIARPFHFKSIDWGTEPTLLCNLFPLLVPSIDWAW